MAKRQASEALDELAGVASPASKKSRTTELDSPLAQQLESDQPQDNSREPQNGRIDGGGGDNEDGDDDLIDDDTEHPLRAAIRQNATTEGYDDLYLDTIDRNVLDFDFEKLCSVSLSNINVYACLVCGKYFQGRGPKSHAYFHALDEDHHVYINLETQRVYVLPEGYEVKSKALDDIKYVSDPRYTRKEVMELDRVDRKSWTLAGKQYTPGFVGMDNIKERHRHRFEYNDAYRAQLEAAGLIVGGTNPQSGLVEIVEVKDHPWMVGVQYHPEFQSRPDRAHPLFAAFVKAAVEKSRLSC